MIVYNTTFAVDPAICSEFVSYIKSEFIPAVLKTNLLSNPRLHRVLKDNAAEEGVSYALHFEAKNMAVLDKYFEEYGVDLNEALADRFANRMAGFITMMEIEEI